MTEKNPVFKFGSASGALAILRNNSIFVTSPLDLNDPFEMRPAWTNAHEVGFREDRERRNALITGIPMFAAMEGGHAVPIGFTPPPLPTPQMDVADQRAIADTHNERVFAELHAHYRVLSFATEVLDLSRTDYEADEKATLMWSHYADQFQGFCLALDPKHFHNGLRLGGFPVGYEKARRSLPPSYYDVYLALGCQQGSFEENIERLKGAYVDLLTHKSPAWSYEHEARMLYEMESLRGDTATYRRLRFPCERCRAQGKNTEACENPLYRDAIHVPAEAVRAVIVGADASVDTVKQLLSIIGEDRYSHVTVYWSSLHSEYYALHYSKSDSDYVKFMQEMRTEQVANAKGHVRYLSDRTTILSAKKGENYEM